MNLKLVFAAAAGLALLSAPAFAADLGAVKLAAPVQKTVKIIADSAVYICNGDACSGAAQKPPLFAARNWKGTPVPREGQELAWVRPLKMSDYAMPPADMPLVAMLRDLL